MSRIYTGINCPNCGRETVELVGAVERIGPNQLIQDARCFVCRSAWVEFYEIARAEVHYPGSDDAECVNLYSNVLEA